MASSLMLREVTGSGRHGNSSSPPPAPEEDFGDAWFADRQQRVLQALGSNQDSQNLIVQSPTPLRAVSMWRMEWYNRQTTGAAAAGHPSQWYTERVLLLLLEEMMRRRPFTFRDMRIAWSRLFVASSPLHLIVDKDLFPEAGHSSYQSVVQVWTVGQRVHRALRLHAQPVQVAKRRKLMGPTPAQEAVAVVLLAWLVTLDSGGDPQVTTLDTHLTAAAATNTALSSYAQRWGPLTAGWTSKLTEAVQLAAWTTAITMSPAPVTTIHSLVKFRPEEFLWDLWARITGLEYPVSVAFWTERLGNAAGTAEDHDRTTWDEVLLVALTWYDPLSQWTTEGHSTGVFATDFTTRTATKDDHFDEHRDVLTAGDDHANVVAGIGRLAIPGYAAMVHGLVSLHRGCWQKCLDLAAKLESQHVKTQPASWVLYQFLFEYFADQGMLLDWPLGSDAAQHSWTSQFQWRSGSLGRQCFVQGFELLSQKARGSLLRDVCLYAMAKMQCTTPWSRALELVQRKRPVLNVEQRVVMDERLLQLVQTGRDVVLLENSAVEPAPKLEGDSDVDMIDAEAYDEGASPRSDAGVSSPVLRGPPEAAVNVDTESEQEEDSLQEQLPDRVHHAQSVDSSSSDDDDDDEEEDADATKDREIHREVYVEEDGAQNDEHEFVQDEDENSSQEETSHPNAHHYQYNEGEASSEDDSHPRRVRPYQHADDNINDGGLSSDKEMGSDRSSQSSSEAEDSEVDQDEQSVDEEHGDEGVVEVISSSDDEDNDDDDPGPPPAGADIRVADVEAEQPDAHEEEDDGDEADVSEDANVVDADESYYATAEDSQEEDEAAHAASQDESNVSPSRSIPVVPESIPAERHVRIDVPPAPLARDLPNIDDGYYPDGEAEHTADEMVSMPPPRRHHHDRDGYQGGESSLGHTEEEDEEISEAAEEDEDNAYVPDAAVNGEAMSRSNAVLDSHSLSGMSAADERGPEEESSELEANESDQVHFPPSHTAQTQVHARASLEDYAVAAAAQQESSLSMSPPRSHPPSDTSQGQDDAAVESPQKPLVAESKVEDISGDSGEENHEDDGTVVGDEAEESKKGGETQPEHGDYVHGGVSPMETDAAAGEKPHTDSEKKLEVQHDLPVEIDPKKADIEARAESAVLHLDSPLGDGGEEADIEMKAIDMKTSQDGPVEDERATGGVNATTSEVQREEDDPPGIAAVIRPDAKEHDHGIREIAGSAEDHADDMQSPSLDVAHDEETAEARPVPESASAEEAMVEKETADQSLNDEKDEEEGVPFSDNRGDSSDVIDTKTSSKDMSGKVDAEAATTSGPTLVHIPEDGHAAAGLPDAFESAHEAPQDDADTDTGKATVNNGSDGRPRVPAPASGKKGRPAPSSNQRPPRPPRSTATPVVPPRRSTRTRTRETSKDDAESVGSQTSVPTPSHRSKRLAAKAEPAQESDDVSVLSVESETSSHVKTRTRGGKMTQSASPSAASATPLRTRSGATVKTPTTADSPSRHTRSKSKIETPEIPSTPSRRARSSATKTPSTPATGSRSVRLTRSSASAASKTAKKRGGAKIETDEESIDEESSAPPSLKRVTRSRVKGDIDDADSQKAAGKQPKNQPPPRATRATRSNAPSKQQKQEGDTEPEGRRNPAGKKPPPPARNLRSRK